MMELLSGSSSKTKKIFFLILLVILSLSIKPLAFKGYMYVNQLVDEGLFLGDIGRVILAALFFVFINTVTELPIIVTGLALGRFFKSNRKRWLSYCIVIGFIILSYILIKLWLDSPITLGIPLIIIISILLLHWSTDLFNMRFRYQLLILVQLLLGLQWFELQPYLQNWGFGNGACANSIMTAAQKLNGQDLLILFSVSIGGPFLISGVITSFLIHGKILRVHVIESSKESEKAMQLMKMEIVKSRTNQEINSLVHDLKTPLTTVQGLISLLQMTDINEKGKEYCKRIEQSVTHLNEMISEILYDDVKQKIEVKKLIDYARAQLITEYLGSATFTFENPTEEIVVNRIRVARALINLIQNGLEATAERKDGKIEINISSAIEDPKTLKKGIIVKISDNGDGIKEEDIDHIWEVNYSTKDSSGLGLPFVKWVVTNHGGWIKLERNQPSGSIFTIFIPKGFEG